MSLYAVYAPAKGIESLKDADKVVAVRDGFSWPAFILTGFWLLFYRQWMGFAVYVALFLAVAVLMQMMGFGGGTELLVGLCVSFWFGIEAPMMRMRALEKQNFKLARFVDASSPEQAYAAFFSPPSMVSFSR